MGTVERGSAGPSMSTTYIPFYDAIDEVDQRDASDGEHILMCIRDNSHSGGAGIGCRSRQSPSTAGLTSSKPSASSSPPPLKRNPHAPPTTSKANPRHQHRQVIQADRRHAPKAQARR